MEFILTEEAINEVLKELEQDYNFVFFMYEDLNINLTESYSTDERFLRKIYNDNEDIKTNVLIHLESKLMEFLNAYVSVEFSETKNRVVYDLDNMNGVLLRVVGERLE